MKASMKILWITGSHPRHLFYVNTINKAFPVSGGIMQRRENIVPKPPEGIAETDRLNFIRHFKNRDIAEQKYFKGQPAPDCPILEVTKDDINSARSIEFVKKIKPDIALTFGCELVREPLMSALPRDTINLHLGLSPRYRGAATLFWPFYFLEPPYAGATFHYIVAEPDAGDIVHHVVPELSPEDNIHDVACKCVVQSALDMVRLLEIFASDGGWKSHRQKSTGKNFLGSDFKPQHLRMIYNVYNDDIVREYLEGRLVSKKPKLVRQF
jgi:methionyl-tRNA formyltransferase